MTTEQETSQTPVEEPTEIEANKKPISHAKLSALSKARSAKLLKQQQKNIHDEMTMSTLNNIYEKLNIIDTKLYSLGKRTADPINIVATVPEPKKQKTDKKANPTPENHRTSYMSYIPTITLFIASSVLSRYASQQLRKFWMERNNTTSDRDNIGWGWMQNDSN